MASRKRKRSYGTGQVIPPQVVGGTWAIRFREGGAPKYRGGFQTRELAERVLAKLAGDAAAFRVGLPAQDPRSAPMLAQEAPGFLERRRLTNRAADCDGYRWKKHLAPHFGHLRPAQVDTARIRAFAETKLREGLSSGTCRILVALLSSLFADLKERGLAASNPARDLPRSLARMLKPSHDPKTTPFVEKLEDVRRIFLALTPPLHVAYAIGALAGLRTGEVFALKWAHVDLAAGRIHVRESVKGPLKDKDSRIVPIQDALAPVLREWKLKSGGEGLVIPPMRRDGQHIRKDTPGKHLRVALEKLGLSRADLGWYEATRHTFASQWVLNGGSIEELKEVLGHSSIAVTERYAHLRPDLFEAKVRGLLAVDLAPAGSVARLRRDCAVPAPEAPILPRKSAGAAL